MGDGKGKGRVHPSRTDSGRFVGLSVTEDEILAQLFTRVVADGPNSHLSYNELRGYTMYDAHAYVLSFDGIAQLYDKKINGTDNAYELLLSAGYRFTPHLLLSGDISYGQNPDYNDELKGLVKLVYNFTSAGKGAQK